MAGLVCNSPVANCLDGNLFRLNAENTSGVVEGRVNGISTGPLPHAQKIILPNDLPGTCNALDLVVNGRNFPLIDNLTDFPLTRPQDVGVLLSDVTNGYSGAGAPAVPEDVLLVAVSASLAGLSPGVQDINLSSADEGTLQWVAVSILVALEQIDEVTGIAALRDATNGAINLGMTGTDGPPLFADMIQILNSGNARQALSVIVKAGADKIRILSSGAGALMIALRVKSGVGRVLAAGIAASLVRSRLANVAMGARGQFGVNAVAQGGGRLPVVGFIIVGTINVIEWYSNPASRGDWSLLISTLFVDFGALTIATLAGTAAVAGIVALLGGAALLTLGSAIMVIAAGIAVGLVVGVGLSWLAEKTGAIDFVNRGLTAMGGALSALAQGAAVVVTTFADRFAQIMEAIDEAVYSPFEAVADAEQEFTRRLDQRINNYINNRLLNLR